MKNFFTGSLAFIVYAGLCLLLYNYLFTDNFKETTVINSMPDFLEEQPIIDDNPIVIEDAVVSTNNSLLTELDSITAMKKSQVENNTTAADSLITDSSNDDIDSKIAVANKQQQVNEEKSITVYEATPFTIKDENGNSLTNCTSFNTIYKNNSKVKIPYNCRAYGNDLIQLLNKNPDAQLIITGYYDNIEDKSTGIGRARYVKKLLTNIGIDGNKIAIKDALKNITFNSGIAQGGIDINLLNMTSGSDISDTKKVVIEKPTEKVIPSDVSKGTGAYAYKRFTSGYQGDYFYGNRSFTSYIREVATHLESNPGKKVYVYGYTDTVGNATDNYNIGKDNANTVKRLMLQNGISSNKIVAVSKGEKSSGVKGNNRGMVIIVK